MNYKDTLNLPSTKFPMKANLPQKEPETIKYWNEIKLYEEIRSKRKGCKADVHYAMRHFINSQTAL